jgi:hypothetical protein
MDVRRSAPLALAMLTLLAPAAFAVAAEKEPAVWRPVLTDIRGAEHRLFSDPKTKAVAMIFTLPDCPIANSFIPEINRLHAAMQSRGVPLLVVQVDPDLTAEAALRHAEEYQIQPPVVLDSQHTLVKKAGATRTPEAAVFSPSGKLLYRGRINDQYVGYGKRRPQATSHDLRDALDAILAGRPAPPGKKAVGCHIPELPEGR